MSLDITPLGPTNFNAVPDRKAAGPRTPAARDALSLSPDAIPAIPPQEVLDAIDAAGRVARELHATGRELRFEPGGENGRVQIDVCDLDGNVIRSIPPSELLDVATGAPLGD